jgi:hypothetical protein
MPNFGGLTDREAAIDAIVRFVVSLDNGDSELCSSALIEDAVMILDFAKTSQTYDPIQGRKSIADLLMSSVGRPLDTTHSATNIRCFVDGDTAELTCCVLAQHFRGGEGPSPEFQDFSFWGNEYKATMVRDGELWKASKLTITPTWSFGKPEVMKVAK